MRSYAVVGFILLLGLLWLPAVGYGAGDRESPSQGVKLTVPVADQEDWVVHAEENALSVSTQCLQKSGSALKWSPQEDPSLMLVHPDGAEVSVKQGQYFNLFIYSPKAGEGLLRFDFLDEAGTVRYSFPFLLNYKGWRQTFCYYKAMPVTDPGLNPFSAIRITAEQGEGPLFLSELALTPSIAFWDMHVSMQVPFVPHRQSALEGWKALTALEPVADAEITEQELADLQLIRQRLEEKLVPSYSAKLDPHLKTFNTYGIRLSDEGYYEGRPIGRVSSFLGMIRDLTRDYILTKDDRALAAIDLGLRYLRDQGIAAGSNLQCFLAVYNYREMFPFLASLKGHIDPELLAQSYATAAWYSDVGAILLREPINTDWLGMSSINTLYYTFFACDDPGKQVALLRAWRDYMKFSTQFSYSGEENLKPDGSIYHHEGHYPARYASIAWSSLIDQYYLMRGTSFSIEEETYERIRAVVTAVGRSATGNSLPWSISGRSGEPERIGEWVRMPIDNFKMLAELGGAFCDGDHDPRVAAMANRLFPSQRMFGEAPEVPPSGFWQCNYVPAGFFRRGNWMIYFRGMTDHLWSTEAYQRGLGHNVYGFYQGHGSLETWYAGTAEENGYRMGGWDYNLFSGTTALRYDSPEELHINTLKFDGNLRQKNPFCGALAFGSGEDDYFDTRGQYGIFAMDFQSQRDTSFTFRKSVFCLNDDYVVTLGDQISSADDSRPLITTLFQRLMLTGEEPPLLIDGREVDGKMRRSSRGVWLLDPQQTGYWVRAGNLRLASEEQTYPIGWEDENSKKPDTAPAAWAYLDHGKAPENASYEYAIVPGTDADSMKHWDVLFGAKKAYRAVCNDAYHAVRDINSGRVGIAVFSPATELPGAVVGADQSCLIVYKANDAGLQLALSNPKLDVTGWKNPLDFQIVKLTLKGKWKAMQEQEDIAISTGKQTTEVAFTTRHGKRYQLHLVPMKR